MIEKSLLHDSNLVVEKTTSRVFEGKFFDEFVLIRPILKPFIQGMRRVTLAEFDENFQDFCGDPDEIRQFIKRPIDTVDVQIEN